VCTLIVLHRVVLDMPLVVAANRDEYYDRPSEGPAIRKTPSGTVLSPLDLREGGTWLGMNTQGVFAAITNRRAESAPAPGRRSRGLLVLDALAADSAAEAADRIEEAASEESRIDHSETKVGAYNPFNLFIADCERAFTITYLDTPQRIELAPGTHVIGNVAPSEPAPKLERIRKAALRAERAPADTVLDELADICRGHEYGQDGEPIDAACVHTSAVNSEFGLGSLSGYGTRSSLLLKVGAAGITNDSRSELRYADGAPCKTRYEDFTPLLSELGLEAQFKEGELVARSAS